MAAFACTPRRGAVLALTGALFGCGHATAAEPAPRTSPRSERATAPAVPARVPGAHGPADAPSPDVDGACPDDPERELQSTLAAPPDPTGWPAEVRLRFLLREDGAIDCISVVSATRPGFTDSCVAQIEGKRRRPRRDAAGNPVAAFLTYLCQFEPKL